MINKKSENSEDRNVIPKRKKEKKTSF